MACPFQCFETDPGPWLQIDLKRWLERVQCIIALNFPCRGKIKVFTFKNSAESIKGKRSTLRSFFTLGGYGASVYTFLLTTSFTCVLQTARSSRACREQCKYVCSLVGTSRTRTLWCWAFKFRKMSCCIHRQQFRDPERSKWVFQIPVPQVWKGCLLALESHHLHWWFTLPLRQWTCRSTSSSSFNHHNDHNMYQRGSPLPAHCHPLMWRCPTAWKKEHSLQSALLLYDAYTDDVSTSF